MKELADMLRLLRKRPDQPMALATIVRTHGSSYRAIGTRMLITRDGQSVGALSAGCLEEDIRQRAADVILTREPVLIPYDTRRLFGCDGQIDVLIERIDASGEWARFLAHCCERRERGVVLTIFEDRVSARCGSHPLLVSSGWWKGALREFREPFASEAETALECDRSTVVELNGTTALLHVIEPPVRLVVASGAYDAAPLAALATALGWTVTVLARPEDDASVFCGAEILPVTAPDEWPVDADSRTAAVIMTHHFGRDAAFLRQLLRLPFGYVGLLGPRRRREQLLGAIAADLADASLAELAHLRNPAGLDIGAETPDEIAVSIIGEIQAVMTSSRGGFLSARKGPIHARRTSASSLVPPR